MEESELDPALAALLGDSRQVQEIDLPVVEEVKITPRVDGDDYITSREQMHVTLGKTMTAIEQMSQLAWQAQHPRGYEVLANLLKTAADLTKDLLILKEKDQKIKGHVPAAGEDDAPTSIEYQDNRQVLMVTSDQLLRMIDDKRKEVEGS